MAFEFPVAPSVGDTYSRFTWDGVAWNITAGGGPGLEVLTQRLALLEDTLNNPPAPLFEGDDVRLLTAPTGADGTPADYNYLVVDKVTGQIKTIDPGDFVEVE